MSKKTRLFALLAVGMALLLAPSAMAEDAPIQIVPTPLGSQTITGGPTILTVGAFKLSCGTSTGTLNFESGGTSGTMHLLYEGINESEALPFQLLTLPGHHPGILVTPAANGVFLKRICPPSPLSFGVLGNGLVGTIIAPRCGEISTHLTIVFAIVSEVQQHRLVEGTSTLYHINARPSFVEGSGMEAALSETLEVSLSGASRFECS